MATSQCIGELFVTVTHHLGTRSPTCSQTPGPRAGIWCYVPQVLNRLSDNGIQPLITTELSLCQGCATLPRLVRGVFAWRCGVARAAAARISGLEWAWVGSLARPRGYPILVSLNGISMTRGLLMPHPPLGPTVLSMPEKVDTAEKLGAPVNWGEK